MPCALWEGTSCWHSDSTGGLLSLVLKEVLMWLAGYTRRSSSCEEDPMYLSQAWVPVGSGVWGFRASSCQYRAYLGVCPFFARDFLVASQ